MDRREFFKVVATTGAAAAVAGCGRASETLLPQVVPNDQIVPGVPSYYATVCRECPAGCGVLAENNNGRVTKLEPAQMPGVKVLTAKRFPDERGYALRRKRSP